MADFNTARLSKRTSQSPREPKEPQSLIDIMDNTRNLATVFKTVEHEDVESILPANLKDSIKELDIIKKKSSGSFKNLLV